VLRAEDADAVFVHLAVPACKVSKLCLLWHDSVYVPSLFADPLLHLARHVQEQGDVGCGAHPIMVGCQLLLSLPEVTSHACSTHVV